MKKIIGLSFQSWGLVVIQFICLAIIIFTDSVFANKMYYLILEIVGIIIGVWAVFVTNPSTLNIFPDIRQEASFVSIGPYRYIRHPMYLGVLIFSISLVLDKSSIFRIVAFIVLLVVLLYKIEFEEKILLKSYPEYKDYRTRTKKLIPFIY